MSTAPVTDEREHHAAINALLEAALGVEPVTGVGRVYGYGDVPGADGNPGELPTIFVLVSIERRFAPVSRMCAAPSRSGWRLSVRYVGRTADEARWALNKATEALEPPVRVVIDGMTATPLQHESSDPITKDEDGRFSGVTFWTYSL